MADELRYTIKADGADKAAADLDKLADKAAAIEGQTVEATVTFDTSRAEQAIARVDGDLSELSNDDKVAILRLEAKQFEREIARARRDLNDLDGEEAQARIRVIDNARANLDLIKGRLDQLDRRTVDVKVEADTQAAASRLDGLAAKIGALAGIGAALSLANDTNQAALNAQTLADALGASLEETSKLLSASRRVGIEYGDIFDIVNQVNGVLDTQPDLVRELGIEAKTPLGRFREAFDAISAIEDPLRRNVLGAKAFGEEGVRQVGALASAYGDYESLLNKGVAATGENVEAARAWRETVADVRAEFGETASAIIADLNNIAAATGLGDNVVGSFFDKLGNAVQNRTTLGFLGNIAEAIRGTGDDADEAAGGVGRLERSLRAYEDSLEQSFATTREARLAWDEFVETQDRTRDAYGRVGRALDAYEERLARVARWIDQHTERVKKATDAEKEWEDAIRSRTDAVLAGLDAEFAVQDAQRQLAEATRESWEAFRAWQDAPAVAARIAEVEAEIASIQSEDRLSENDKRRLDALNQELQRLRAQPTGTREEFERAFADEQQAILRQAASAGQLAGFWGADSAGQTQAQIDELNRIRGQVPAQSDFIDRVIANLQRALSGPMMSGGGGISPDAFSDGWSGVKQSVQVTATIITGADPQAVNTALASIAQAGANVWGIR